MYGYLCGIECPFIEGFSSGGAYFRGQQLLCRRDEGEAFGRTGNTALLSGKGVLKARLSKSTLFAQPFSEPSFPGQLFGNVRERWLPTPFKHHLQLDFPYPTLVCSSVFGTKNNGYHLPLYGYWAYVVKRGFEPLCMRPTYCHSDSFSIARDHTRPARLPALLDDTSLLLGNSFYTHILLFHQLYGPVQFLNGFL